MPWTQAPEEQLLNFDLEFELVQIQLAQRLILQAEAYLCGLHASQYHNTIVSNAQSPQL